MGIDKLLGDLQQPVQRHLELPAQPDNHILLNIAQSGIQMMRGVGLILGRLAFTPLANGCFTDIQ